MSVRMVNSPILFSKLYTKNIPEMKLAKDSGEPEKATLSQDIFLLYNNPSINDLTYLKNSLSYD